MRVKQICTTVLMTWGSCPRGGRLRRSLSWVSSPVVIVLIRFAQCADFTYPHPSPPPHPRGKKMKYKRNNDNNNNICIYIFLSLFIEFPLIDMCLLIIIIGCGSCRPNSYNFTTQIFLISLYDSCIRSLWPCIMSLWPSGYQPKS